MSTTLSANKIEKKLLHYTGQAIDHYKMLHHQDRVLVCLSGGKDSFTLLNMLELIRKASNLNFSIHVFTLNQGQPGWQADGLEQYLRQRNFSYTILNRNTYKIVKDKIPEGKTYCSLCSRLRRGIIYDFAEKNGFTKIALGHHRDDLIQTLLMSILYSGAIRSMPPKLLTNNKKHIVIRPLVYCQEQDIITYAQYKQFPLLPCNLCNSQTNLIRTKVATLIKDLAQTHPKVPSNILHAISNVQPSQLMDHALWDFKNLILTPAQELV